MPLLLLALLLAQGLRLCLHAPHAADEGHAHATAIHLESNLASPADSDDDAKDSHVSLSFVPFKPGQFDDGIAAAVLPAAVLLLLLFRQTAHVPAPVEIVPTLSSGHRLRPPLRAPPR